MRVFIALSIPADVADQVSRLQSGVAGARWRPIENLHVTLAFVGDVDAHEHRELALALSAVRAPGFSMHLGDVGQFGGAKPHSLWLDAVGGEPLLDLHHKVETACRRAGLRTDARKFIPHVTLAYLKGAAAVDVAAYAQRHGGRRTRDFFVDAFHLYSSHPGDGANLYRVERSYPLQGGPLGDFEDLEEGFL